MDKFYSGNKNASGNFMRVARSIKSSVGYDIHVAEVCRITSIVNNEYYCTTLTQGYNVTATKLQGLSLSNNDIVLVIFTDTDFRINLNKLKHGGAINNMDSESHSMSYGIIIGKL